MPSHETMQCPDCDGEGRVSWDDKCKHRDGSRIHDSGMARCDTCDGTGEVAAPAPYVNPFITEAHKELVKFAAENYGGTRITGNCWPNGRELSPFEKWIAMCWDAPISQGKPHVV